MAGAGRSFGSSVRASGWQRVFSGVGIGVVVLICAAALLPAVALSASGPVLAMGFDEASGATVADASGRGNEGDVVGPAWATAGRFGAGLSFDGVDDRVVVADSDSLDVSSAFTVEAWVRPAAAVEWAPIVVKEGPAGRAYALFASGASPTSAVVGEAGALSLEGAQLPANEWSHVAMTYTGSVLELYVDGETVASTFGAGSVPITAGELSLGGTASVPGGFFEGTLDELRIYPRALSPAEIAEDRDRSVGAEYDSTTPEVGYSGLLASLGGRTIATDADLRIDAVDGTTEKPRSGVRSIEVLVDGLRKDYQEQACAQGSCSMSRTWTFVAAQYAPGAHLVRAVTSDQAGNETSRTWTVTIGTGRITSLQEGERTARRLLLESTATGGQSAVRFQYRTSEGGAWADIPTATLRRSDGQAISGWPLAVTDEKTPSLVWDLVGSSGQPGMISSGAASGDKAFQVRAVFEGGAGGTSQEVWTALDRKGVDTRNATSPIGPGEVDLLTGAFSLSATDVSIDAYKADLTVTRTYHSNQSEDGVLGRGWTLGIPIEQASAAYTSLYNLAETDGEPYVIVTGAYGEEAVFSEVAGGYKPEPGFETLKLTRVMSTSNPGAPARFELTDTQAGETMTFKGAGTGAYSLADVQLTGVGNATSYDYDREVTPPGQPPSQRLLLKRMTAPEAVGVDCNDALARGCRALEFNYTIVNGRTRLANIVFVAWDDGAGAMTNTTVATYAYHTSGTGRAGMLHQVDDPRDSTQARFYDYDSGRLNWTQHVPGEAPFFLAYSSSTADPNAFRLKTATRDSKVTTVVYDVALSGASAPYAMAAADVAAWGQSSLPVDATAIFRPDDVPANPPASYEKATINYLDAKGRRINVATRGGHISSAEYDAAGNTTRELTAGNRARSLAHGSTATEHADRANQLDTRRVFSSDGIRLLEEFGPERTVELADGSSVSARRHSTYAYDQGAPSTGGPYNLPTTASVGARVTGEATDREVRTTKTDYDWALRQPTTNTVDPAGLNLRTVTVYDAQTGLPVETRMPRNPAGGDASATRTIYYTAGTNPEDSDCGDRPDWVGLACKVKSVQQPATPGLPDLPVTTTEYNRLRQPTANTETTGAAERVTTNQYDAAGRVTATEVSSTHGDPVPRITYTYDAQTGRLEGRKATATDGKWTTFDTTFDWLGRPRIESTDDSGPTSASHAEYTFDALDRVTERKFRGVTETFEYDPVRGLLSKVNDPEVGSITAEYGPDGELVRETYVASGLRMDMTYDETGAATGRSYTKTAGCSSDCTWLDFQASESIHGQWTSQEGTLSDQRFNYDAAGRLTRTQDTPAGQGCVTRSYELDADSNRQGLTTHAPAGDGSCSTATSSTSRQHTHDAADRLTTSGVEYDPFGRITRVPAEDAGGAALQTSYYANDRVRTLTQGAQTVTYELDPLLRQRQRTETNANPETTWYADTTDEPIRTEYGTTRTRYVSGPSGDLAAVATNRGQNTTVRLQLSNLHGDTVADVAPTDTALDPNSTFETDEYGVPSNPFERKVRQVGQATSTALSTAATTLTLTRPTDAQKGDLLLAGFSASSSSTITAPAGWTAAPISLTGNPTIRVYWRVVGDSEPTSYAFDLGHSAKHRGGIVALRGADTTNPISAVGTDSGHSATKPPKTATVWPTVHNTAVVSFIGGASGDSNGNGAWAFNNPFTELWDVATGTAQTGDGTHAAALQIVFNGKDREVAASPIANETGFGFSWGAVSIAVAPKPIQTRYGYVGAKQRELALPSGAISMGARVYLPQLGRFLQTDPVKGGSANRYDYANQDPTNTFDLAGLWAWRMIPFYRCGVAMKNWSAYIIRQRAYFTAINSRRDIPISSATQIRIIQMSGSYHDVLSYCGDDGLRMVQRSFQGFRRFPK